MAANNDEKVNGCGEPIKKMKQELVLIRGPTGSGKTTLAKEHFVKQGPHFSIIL